MDQPLPRITRTRASTNRDDDASEEELVNPQQPQLVPAYDSDEVYIDDGVSKYLRTLDGRAVTRHYPQIPIHRLLLHEPRPTPAPGPPSGRYLSEFAPFPQSIPRISSRTVLPPPGFENLGHWRVMSSRPRGLSHFFGPQLSDIPESVHSSRSGHRVSFTEDGAPCIRFGAAAENQTGQQHNTNTSNRNQERGVMLVPRGEVVIHHNQTNNYESDEYSDEEMPPSAPVPEHIARYRDEFEAARSFSMEDDLLHCPYHLLTDRERAILDERNRKAAESQERKKFFNNAMDIIHAPPGYLDSNHGRHRSRNSGSPNTQHSNSPNAPGPVMKNANAISNQSVYIPSSKKHKHKKKKKPKKKEGVKPTAQGLMFGNTASGSAVVGHPQGGANFQGQFIGNTQGNQQYELVTPLYKPQNDGNVHAGPPPGNGNQAYTGKTQGNQQYEIINPLYQAPNNGNFQGGPQPGNKIPQQVNSSDPYYPGHNQVGSLGGNQGHNRFGSHGGSKGSKDFAYPQYGASNQHHDSQYHKEMQAFLPVGKQNLGDMTNPQVGMASTFDYNNNRGSQDMAYPRGDMAPPYSHSHNRGSGDMKYPQISAMNPAVDPFFNQGPQPGAVTGNSGQHTGNTSFPNRAARWAQRNQAGARFGQQGSRDLAHQSQYGAQNPIHGGPRFFGNHGSRDLHQGSARFGSRDFGRQGQYGAPQSGFLPSGFPSDIPKSGAPQSGYTGPYTQHAQSASLARNQGPGQPNYRSDIPKDPSYGHHATNSQSGPQSTFHATPVAFGQAAPFGHGRNTSTTQAVLPPTGLLGSAPVFRPSRPAVLDRFVYDPVANQAQAAPNSAPRGVRCLSSYCLQKEPTYVEPGSFCNVCGTKSVMVGEGGGMVVGGVGGIGEENHD